MKVTFIEIETSDGITEHAIIDKGDGNFESMPKSEYDRREAAKENGTIS